MRTSRRCSRRKSRRKDSMSGSPKVTLHLTHFSDDPERKRFDKLLQWLSDGGSKFDKLKIRYYSKDYRGVHAARNIKKGDIVLFVPLSQIITLEMAFESPIGRKMVQKNMKNRLLSPKHSFLSTYLM